MNSLQQTCLLEPSGCVRYPVKDVHGHLLLAAGAELTDRVRDLLQRQGGKIALQAAVQVRRDSRPGVKVSMPWLDLLIGRGKGCDMPVDDAMASLEHCALHKRDLVLYLEDLGSRNGTYLNGKRVSYDISVNDKDVLKIGRTELVLEVAVTLNAAPEEVHAVALNALRHAERKKVADSGRTMRDPELKEAHAPSILWSLGLCP